MSDNAKIPEVLLPHLLPSHLVVPAKMDQALRNLLLVAVVSAMASGLISFTGSYIMSQRVQELHLSINSKMDRLLVLTAQAAYEKGQAAGETGERSHEERMNQQDQETDKALRGPAGPKGPKGDTGRAGR